MLLLSTSSLKGYGLHKIFTLVKKSKYDGIDLCIDEKNFDTLDENYLKGLSDAFEVPVLSITAQDKGLNQEKVDKIAKIAKTLNSQIINFYPPHITDKNMDFFSKYLLKLKKDLRIKITLQNVEQKFLLFIIPEYRNSNLIDLKKITGDTALNLSSIDKSSGVDLIKAQAILGNTLSNIYFNDRTGIKDLLLPGCAGGGVSYLPLESFLMRLKISGYNGFFSLKVKPTELGAGNDEKVLYNLEYIKNYYNKHFINYK
ncbi:MAG: hypothetical protein PHE25_05385 [Candidatus Gracilibacteria bacterium]|nr:hypothetical protein [Candidatus Gracilibacteria bacterium]